MWRKFICWAWGHNLRPPTKMEIKIACAEMQAHERTMNDLIGSICIRCDINFDFTHMKFVRPVKKCQCKEAVGQGKHVVCDGYNFNVA